MRIDDNVHEEVQLALLQLVKNMNDEYAERQYGRCVTLPLETPTFPQGALIGINEVTTRDD